MLCSSLSKWFSGCLLQSKAHTVSYTRLCLNVNILHLCRYWKICLLRILSSSKKQAHHNIRDYHELECMLFSVVFIVTMTPFNIQKANSFKLKFLGNSFLFALCFRKICQVNKRLFKK